MTTITGPVVDAVVPAEVGACPGHASGVGCCGFLRNEDLENVWRSLGMTAATLPGCRDALLTAGETSLSTRPTDLDVLESGRLKAKLGEMLIERELLEARIAALGTRGPGRRSGPREARP